MIKQIIIMVALSGAPMAQAEDRTEYAFDCDFMLMVSQNPQQFSAPSPVAIRFNELDGDFSDIHVVDAGGILFPGANMAVVRKGDTVTLGGADFPAERPGTWKVSREGDKYKFALDDEGETAVTFILTTKAMNDDGEHVAIWNAANQPDGMPAPLRGTGVGYCKPTIASEGAE